MLLPGEGYRLSTRNIFRITFALSNTVNLGVWVPEGAFPQLYGYTSFSDQPVPTSGNRVAAGEHSAFAYANDTLTNVIGMYNTAEGRSRNALNFHRIYEPYEVTSASANIRIPALFRLTPETLSATRGRVEVIAQRVRVTRRSASGLPPFTVGISGEGIYDETTGILLVTFVFDESELGILQPVVRRYSYESRRRDP